MKLTVFFDGQFWVGVIEEENHGKIKASRVLFGSEPKDSEVLDFVKKELLDWINRSKQSVKVEKIVHRKINPKRMAREAAKEMRKTGVNTYAQQALQLEYEARKKEKKMISREKREAMKEYKREIARQKAKAKHRGR
jgi:hypothetical protein